MSDEDGISVLDEKGRLFGLVNVVDVLVVLLVLALIIGGMALIQTTGEETTEGPDATRYVTLDFGTLEPYVASQIEVGDTWNNSAGESITITDVYRFETQNGTAVFVRSEVVSTVDESGEKPVVRLQNTLLQIGHQLGFGTQSYSVESRIVSVDESDETLPIEQRHVTVRANVSTELAESIGEGDEYRIDDETIATVQNVERTGTAGSNRRSVELELEVLALDRDGTITFAGKPLRLGATILFRTSDYELSGEIIRVST
jgi:hypothetical protein